MVVKLSSERDRGLAIREGSATRTHATAGVVICDLAAVSDPRSVGLRDGKRGQVEQEGDFGGEGMHFELLSEL